MNEPHPNPDLSVVIPVFNEEESIPTLGESLHAALSALDRSYEVLLVDDGSRDASWARLRDCADRYPHFRLIRLRRNFGQTAAMSAGIRSARGGIVITLDADLQNDPADIPKLLEVMDEDTDVVSGWRKDRKDPFFSRRLPSILANSLISRITGVFLHDYGCTLKAYRREVIQNVRLYGEMHRFIPALASWIGGDIKEVVVGHNARQFGASKYGLSRTFRVVLDLITVKFILRYSMGPIQIFGKIGGMLLLPGLLLMAGVVVANLSFHVFGTTFAAELIKRPFWVIGPLMLVVLGIQFISIGLLAEIQIRTYHESQDKYPYLVRDTYESPTA